MLESQGPSELKGEPSQAWGRDETKGGKGALPAPPKATESRGWEGSHSLQENTYPNESSEANLPRAEQPPGAARFLLQLF